MKKLSLIAGCCLFALVSAEALATDRSPHTAVYETDMKPLRQLQGFHGDTTQMAPYYLIGADRKLLLINKKGEVLAQKIYKKGCIHDITTAFNQSNPSDVMVSYADGIELLSLPELQFKWGYEPKEKAGGAVFSAEYIPAFGNDIKVKFAENSTGMIRTMSSAETVDSEGFQTEFFKKGNHHNFRIMRSVEETNLLVCHSGKNIVREYTPEGKVVWEQKVKQLAFKAQRLPNGNTLISSLNQIEEYTPDHKVVWSFHKNDIKDCRIVNMTGFEVLPNGNILVGCYSPHAKNNPGQSFFEITRDKKMVWGFSNRKEFASVMTIIPINEFTPPNE